MNDTSIDFQNATIAQLRKAGNKVRVIHSRFYRLSKFPRRAELKNRALVPLSTFRKGGNPEEINAKGGRTFIQLTTKDGQEYVGQADCSLKDCFNRKLGIKIALGRLQRL